MGLYEHHRMKMLKRNKDYKEFITKREKIKSENPNVRTFLEDREPVELTDVESECCIRHF